jgi:hypothetical protein
MNLSVEEGLPCIISDKPSIPHARVIDNAAIIEGADSV